MPADLQQAVYAAYDPGAGFRQSEAWLAAVDAAVASLRPAGTEGLPL